MPVIDALREYVTLHARGVPDFKVRELVDDLVEDLRMLINRRASTSGMTKQQVADFRRNVNDEMDDLARELSSTIEDRMRAILSEL